MPCQFPASLLQKACRGPVRLCPAGDRLPVRLLVVVAPAYVWPVVLSALPHKEERFLYVVYPLVSWPSCSMASPTVAQLRGVNKLFTCHQLQA